MPPPITPGRITSLWVILRTVARYPGISRDETAKIASATSLRGGGLPIRDGLQLAELAGYIDFHQDRSRTSTQGQQLLSVSERDEPTPYVIREIALTLVNRIQPSWTAFSDPSIPTQDRMIAIPEGWREVLEDAGLFDSPTSKEVREWWDSVHQINENLLDEFRSKIGRKGEELTLAYEVERLKASSRSDLAERVKWISQVEDRYGFDVASFSADLVPGLEKEAPILIEVKSSTSTSRKRIAFDLTRNEWDVAERNEHNYFFYFWHGISPDEDVDSQNHVTGPFILSMSAIRSRIPRDSATDLGRWTKCHIELSFDEVSSQFARK